METGYWGQKVRADWGEPLAASIHHETRQLRPERACSRPKAVQIISGRQGQV